MKKCPLCGREFENGTKCTSCGVFLIDTETNQAVSPDNGKKKRIRPEKKKKSRRCSTIWSGKAVFFMTAPTIVTMPMPR